MNKTDTIKIEKVNIQEFKCLKDIEKNLAGQSVLLIGDNEVGKTSFAQFIQIAIGRQGNIPPNSKGKGEVIITKEGKEYLLKVKIEEGKSYVTITGPDGMSDNKKGTLARLIGAVEFDIDEFVQLSKSKAGQKKQVEIFKGFLDEDVRMDIAKYESNVQVAFNERSEMNRTITELQGAIKSNPLNHLMTTELDKIEAVDTTKALADLKAKQEANEKYNKVHRNFEARAVTIEDTKKDIEKLQASLKEVEGLQAQAETWMKSNTKSDTSALEATISNASENNTKHAHALDLKKKNALLKTLVEESGEMTAKIESERQAIRDSIRDMTTPIAGLSFDEEKLIYNGQPVHPDVLSESQIMELGMLMKIAENPRLGVVFLERTESYGKKRWEEILKIAKDNNLQIVGEKVKYGQEELTIELFTL